MAHDTQIAAAKAVMAEHIRALNAHDEAGLAATLHFPHFRLSGSQMKSWDTPDAYFADFRSRAGGDWSHSTADDIHVLAASNNKVHLDVEIRRFDKQGEQLTAFRSLWVFTELEGIWAAQIRSSFAAK